jgi:hypothetical protein
MSLLLKMLDDPIWQVLALAITLAAPVLIVAMSTRDVYASEHEIRQILLTILPTEPAPFLLLSRVELALHLPDAVPQRTSSAAPQPVQTLQPPSSSTLTPASIPTPTLTPRLTYSMTQVLVTFCDAVNTREYQTPFGGNLPAVAFLIRVVITQP